MASASFLKFQPGLPKQGALVVTRQAPPASSSGERRKHQMTKEERARQRHSVEVTSNEGSNYLHIQPSILESLTRSAANANANRNRKKPESSIKEEVNDIGVGNNLSALPELMTVTVLPPALKSLVFLWEELSTNTLQAIEQQTVLPSPLTRLPSVKLGKRPFSNDPISKLPGVGEVAATKENKKPSISKESRKEWKSEAPNLSPIVIGDGMAIIERDTCELCGLTVSYPVPEHMQNVHPGCGWNAGGKGYNASGSYCIGWAGNCGEGGSEPSAWYLLCDTCRGKYMKNLDFRLTRKRKHRRNANHQRHVSSPNSPDNDETHVVVKNNAMFLLDLASAAGVCIPKQQHHRVSQTLSSVAENYSPPESSGPFPSTGPFQCLHALGVTNLQTNEERAYEEALRRQNANSYEGNSGGFTNSNGRVSLFFYSY